MEGTQNLATNLVIGETTPSAETDLVEFRTWLEKQVSDRPITSVTIVGIKSRRAIMRILGQIKPWLADAAEMTCYEADYASVYEALTETVLTQPEYRYEKLTVASTEGERPGRAVGILTFLRGRQELQLFQTIPADKNKMISQAEFRDAVRSVPLTTAEKYVREALTHWHASTEEQAQKAVALLAREFPDESAPTQHWHEAMRPSFTQFFTWGHDHDFGFGCKRLGAMGTRHIEIITEAISLGMIPPDLSGMKVLDVGCWTGGDALVLAGLGAQVTTIEEHPVTSRAAQRLFELSGGPIELVADSLYHDRQEWKQFFDLIYCSGVIYHVTDPLLLLRICFAYLKPGGRVILETKANPGAGSICSYCGTLEKGWNWYAPTREVLGRWLVDAGFPLGSVLINERDNGRLLALAIKEAPVSLPNTSGFSRPSSWLIEST